MPPLRSAISGTPLTLLPGPLRNRPLLALVLLCLLAFAWGLAGPLVYDDVLQVGQREEPWRYLRAPVEFDPGFALARPNAGSFYRPLFWLSLWPSSPFVLHVFNLAVHALNACLLWLWLLRVTEANAAWLAAAFWVVLPIHAETAVWISGRSISCAVACLLSALLVRGSFASVALAFAGSLFHEIALIYPLLRWHRFALVPVLAALALRFGIGASYPAFELDWRQPLHAAGFYLLPFIYRGVELSRAAFIPYLGLVPLAAFGIATLRNSVRWRFALRLYFIALLPFLGILPLYQVFAERYAYLASAGLALLVAGVLVSRPILAPAALAALVLVSAHASTRFYSEAELYRHSLQFAPASYILHFNLGVLESNAESYRTALALQPKYVPARLNLAVLEGDAAALRRIVKEYPDHASAWLNLGNLLQRDSRLPEAQQAYAAALRAQPTYPEAHLNLAALYLRQENLPKVREHLSQAGNLPQVWLNWAVYSVLSGDDSEAERYFQLAMAAEPDNPNVASNYRRFQALRSERKP